MLLLNGSLRPIFEEIHVFTSNYDLILKKFFLGMFTYSLVTWLRLVVYSQIFESVFVMLLASTVVKVAILVTSDSLSIIISSCASVRLFSSFNRSSIKFTISAELSEKRSIKERDEYWLLAKKKKLLMYRLILILTSCNFNIFQIFKI